MAEQSHRAVFSKPNLPRTGVARSIRERRREFRGWLGAVSQTKNRELEADNQSTESPGPRGSGLSS
jgi:hypothetical protein